MFLRSTKVQPTFSLLSYSTRPRNCSRLRKLCDRLSRVCSIHSREQRSRKLTSTEWIDRSPLTLLNSDLPDRWSRRTPGKFWHGPSVFVCCNTIMRVCKLLNILFTFLLNFFNFWQIQGCVVVLYKFRLKITYTYVISFDKKSVNVYYIPSVTGKQLWFTLMTTALPSRPI